MTNTSEIIVQTSLNHFHESEYHSEVLSPVRTTEPCYHSFKLHASIHSPITRNAAFPTQPCLVTRRNNKLDLRCETSAGTSRRIQIQLINTTAPSICTSSARRHRYHHPALGSSTYSPFCSELRYLHSLAPSVPIPALASPPQLHFPQIRASICAP